MPSLPMGQEAVEFLIAQGLDLRHVELGVVETRTLYFIVIFDKSKSAQLNHLHPSLSASRTEASKP